MIAIGAGGPAAVGPLPVQEHRRASALARALAIARQARVQSVWRRRRVPGHRLCRLDVQFTDRFVRPADVEVAAAEEAGADVGTADIGASDVGASRVALPEVAAADIRAA